MHRVAAGRIGKTYHFNGLAGCVEQWTARDTRTPMSLYHGPQAGIEDDPQGKWVVICELHHTLVGHPTLADARRTRSPVEFCDKCRERSDKRLKEQGP